MDSASRHNAVERKGNLDEDAQPFDRARVGLRAGAYQIVEEIGSGGMAAVYRAFRADDQYRKQVAIKLVRTGQDSTAVVQRFRSEHQILATLNHPNIARLLDGGTTEDGSPYFVMELIDGFPIDEYCDRHRLAVSERLKLFRQVCSAVHYAHQHLIIHRDIKPTNILVTSGGVPTLLDFGIAKILDPTVVNGQVEPTRTIYRALTPGYASPEQLMDGTITTTSDVYSLGVVLFELLTGRLPYRLTERSPQEIAKAVCDLEPQKPSSAVRRSRLEGDGGEPEATTPADVAAARQTSPAKLEKRLRGDLDNIVLMALRKEPQRRYASVEEFSRDIECHLERLPVVAHKDSVWYRSSKFFARHKAGVIGGAAIALTLLLGTAVTLWEGRIARAQQARAERNFKDVRKLANSVMFDIHDSIRDLPGSTPARKMLVDQSLKYLDGLATEAGDDTALMRELALGYERVATVQGYPFGANLGDAESATKSFRKAARIWDSVSTLNHGDQQDLLGLAANYRQLAGMQANGGGDDPLEAVRKALAVSARLKSSASADLTVAVELELDYRMAGLIQTRTGGDPVGALENLSKALAIEEQSLHRKPDDRDLRQRYAVTRVWIADALSELDRRTEALEESRLGLETFRSDPGYTPWHRYFAISLGKRGDIQMMSGDAVAALRSYREAQSLQEPDVAADPQNAQAAVDLAVTYAQVAHALSWQGNKDALAKLERTAGLLEQLAGDPRHTAARSELGTTHVWMAESLAGTGKLSAALENYRKGTADFAATAAILPWDHYFQGNLADGCARMGTVLGRMGRAGEAAAEYQRALDIAVPLTQSQGRSSLPWYAIAEASAGMGTLSAAAADCREARAWFQRSAEAWRHIPNPGAMSPAGFAVRYQTHAARSDSFPCR